MTGEEEKFDWSKLGVKPSPTKDKLTSDCIIVGSPIRNGNSENGTGGFAFVVQNKNSGSIIGARGEGKLTEIWWGKDEFLVEIMKVEQPMKLFRNNEEVQNNRGYPVKLFVIFTNGAPLVRPSKADLIRVLKAVANRINQDNSDYTTSVDESNLFLCPRTDEEKTTVWSDVMGLDVAEREMKKKLGLPFPGYYDVYKEDILNFFRPGEMEPRLVREMDGPRELMDSSKLEAEGLQLLQEMGADDVDDEDSEDVAVKNEEQE